MKQNIILMNFKLPVSLKSDFENCCRAEYISMSARLNLMIRDHTKSYNLKMIANSEHEWNTGPAGMLSTTDFEIGSERETRTEAGDR